MSSEKIHALKDYPENANTAKQVNTYCGWHLIEKTTVHISKTTCKVCLTNMKDDADQIVSRYAKILGYLTEQLSKLD